MPETPRQKPLYLARRSYRQRRLRDAARVLPIAVAILWILPLVASAPKTSTTSLYLFGIWLMMILIAAGITWKLRDEPEQAENAPDLLASENA